ncbi:hypothetical protein MNBD_NITROSPINAE04-321 [hydrothermal vent metagenome]|uniref:Uncharacterized protein n=1 Tax=hydrothermal vent metagenome TaxID=652676 RepID=A0A3B1CR84_9ZZZZ
MKIDIRRVESKRTGMEKEMAQVSKSLQSVLSRFKQALKYRKTQREKLFDEAEKVARRRMETARILRDVVIKLDKTKSALARGSVKLSQTEKEESVLRGKYKELLMGRIPADVEDIDEILSDNGHGLERRKKMFLSRIEDTFAELDRKIAQIGRRKGELPATLEKYKKTVDYYERKSEILKKTLKMYKNELVNYDSEIADTIEQEELLLQEYTDFSERLGAVASIPGAMERLLEKNLGKAGANDSASSN